MLPFVAFACNKDPGEAVTTPLLILNVQAKWPTSHRNRAAGALAMEEANAVF
jgi:hypothetical protein